MSGPNNLPENAPFGHEQKIALNALLPTLQPQQAAWLSGYFAHLAQMAGGAIAAAPARAAAAPAAPTVPLTILFGSESGNAEGCAQQVDKAAKAAGFRSTVYDMGDYPMDKLASEKNVLIVVSTWGEGDPPERAVAFHEYVHSDGAPKLEGVNFSVCALGDTSYPDFCECGIQFDKRFAELGAKRIHDRVDCDLDFEEPFQAWLNAVMPKMVEVAGVKEAVAAAASGGGVALAEPPAGFDGGFALPAFAPPVVEEAYSKKRPFPALVKESFVLNDSASAKETLHVELDLAGSGLVYEPGDALGLIPTNCPEVVDDMLRLAGFRGDEIKEVEGDFFSLHELLRDEYDVTSLNRSVMAKYVPMAKNKRLENLLKEENKAELETYLHGREIRDLFLDFPPADPLTVDQLITLLRKIPPRLYSIASSLRVHPEEVHLCVAVVRYHTHGKDRKGVASTLLNDRLKVGDKAKVYVHTNKNFRLPEDPATPVIMVGPGTGVAPFRAFLEERSSLGAPGKNWLFFGDQRFQYDFLYQTEWQDYLKSGALTRMDVAFSRDTDKKVYVQHRMKERAKDLYAWLEEGAYFYVCGDASRMAKDVHTALIEVIAEQGGRSTDEAEAYVKQLQKDRRYQRDVY
jgi:sulfite reductase (NADPH) flavoprotein alpha-component